MIRKKIRKRVDDKMRRREKGKGEISQGKRRKKGDLRAKSEK